MKYKQLITGLFCSIAAMTAQAQQSSWFEAEGDTYYVFEQAVPGSQILFYTRSQGTKMIKEVTADTRGQCILKAAGNFRPDFAVNARHGIKQDIPGTGKSRPYSTRSFSFDALSLRHNEDQVTISWNAAVPADPITFDILKSEDGLHFTVAGSINARQAAAVLPYSFTDAHPATFYRVNVTDRNGIKYSSKMLLQDQDVLKVYPTKTTDRFSIELKGSRQQGDYQVLNELGQAVLSGSLEGQRTTLSAATLAAGNYFILVRSEGKQLVSRVIKY